MDLTVVIDVRHLHVMFTKLKINGIQDLNKRLAIDDMNYVKPVTADKAVSGTKLSIEFRTFFYLPVDLSFVKKLILEVPLAFLLKSLIKVVGHTVILDRVFHPGSVSCVKKVRDRTGGIVRNDIGVFIKKIDHLITCRMFTLNTSFSSLITVTAHNLKGIPYIIS